MNRKHTPTKRLNSAKVGQTVSLFTGDSKHQNLYVGSQNDDGYSFLWRSQDEWATGKSWQTMASGSHEIEVVQ
jgi:hypothetical protein